MSIFNIFKFNKKDTKSSTQGNENLYERYAFSGRAYSRHAISILVLIILLLLGIITYLIYNNYMVVKELNRRNFATFTEKCDGTIEVGKIADFQTGADERTVRSLAWNIVRYIKSAGTNNAEVVFDEASRLMTPDMKQAFSVISDAEKGNLKRLSQGGQGVYRVIDSAKVKLLEKEDLPPGTKFNVTQYDAVVTGICRVLANETKQELAREEFSILVRTVPLTGRTEANPWGLLVSSMDILDPNKSLRVLQKKQEERDKQNSSGSTIGDVLGLSPDSMQKDRERIAEEERRKAASNSQP